VRTCYFAPNICSSLPSWLERAARLPLGEQVRTESRPGPKIGTGIGTGRDGRGQFLWGTVGKEARLSR
jgi:hypothetical protein